MELSENGQFMLFDDHDRLAMRVSRRYPIDKAPTLLRFIIVRENNLSRDLKNVESYYDDDPLSEETEPTEELYLAKLDRLEILKYQVGEVAAPIIVKELLESIEGIDEVSLAAEPPTRLN